MKNNLKEVLIEEGIFRKDGGLNSSWIRLKSNNHDFSSLDGDTIQEKMYILFNGRKYCTICGKATPFKNWSYGFNLTCSKECKKIFDANTLREKASKKCQSEESKEKRKNTNLKKYGSENVFGNKKIQEKIKETLVNKYGVEHPSQNEEVLNKMKSTSYEKYGKEYYTQTEEYKEKYKETCLEKYGQEYYLHSDDYNIKTEKTYLEKTGTTHNFKDFNTREKIKETNLKKYGVEYPMQNTSIRKKSLGAKKMNVPEGKMYEFLSNRGFDFEYQYISNNKCFDFAIFKNKKLSILIEIDGEYFHGISEDPNDKHVKGFNDNERFINTPNGVKLIICDSLKIEKCFEEILRVFDIEYEEWIHEIIKSLPNEFPFPTFDLNRIKKDYNHLLLWEDIKPKGRLCDSVITTYHKSIYTSNRGSLPSPYEAWYNKELLEKCVRNRFIYSSSLSSKNILQGFNSCKIAPRVSVFSASLSKYLIIKYLNEYSEIFDPFSGFSGRMLGTCASNKKYIGQDISETRIKESLDIRNLLKLNADLSCKDIFNSKGTYECLFTCSPYNLKEKWDTELTNLSCDEWIKECISRFKCNKYLFVVDNTTKYKDYIVEEINNTSHFGNNKEYVVLI